MLKCHLDDATNTAVITVKGNLITILADLTYLIHDIYLEFRSNDHAAGCVFKHDLQRIIGDNSSPVWEESDTGEAEKHGVNNISIRIPREMQELLDDLKGGKHDE